MDLGPLVVDDQDLGHPNVHFQIGIKGATTDTKKDAYIPTTQQM